MKKIIILLLLFLSPCFVYARACDNSVIDELKNQIKDVDFNIEYAPSSDNVDKEDYFKITAENLPSGFVVKMNYNTTLSYMFDNTGEVTLKGGVYTVEFLNGRCAGDTIKSYTMMVPYYVETGDDVWFDGTYREESENDTADKITMKRKNITLIIIGVVATIIIIIISVILIRKRRKIK